MAAEIATGTAAAKQESGQTVTVEVGPDGDFVFTPGTKRQLYITPGTTVKFVWKSGGHNIHVDSQPDGADWQGYEQIEDAGFSYTHTFDVKGNYHYWCVPHKSLGMIADIVVNDTGNPPEGGTQTSTTKPTPSESENGTTTKNPTTTSGGSGGGGQTKSVNLVDYAFNPGTKNPLEIKPGTTVKFVWETGGHNIHVDSQPDEADWEGHEPIEDSGFTYEHTFNVKGKYHYWCVPHKSLGMVADIVVTTNPSAPSGGGEGGGSEGGGGGEVDPEEMGIPLQSHFVGLATILGIMISLLFTFFFLKYGTSPHTGYPEKED